MVPEVSTAVFVPKQKLTMIHLLMSRLTQTIDGFLKMAKRTPNVWYRMMACMFTIILCFSVDTYMVMNRPNSGGGNPRHHFPSRQGYTTIEASSGSREVAAHGVQSRSRLLAPDVFSVLRRDGK